MKVDVLVLAPVRTSNELPTPAFGPALCYAQAIDLWFRWTETDGWTAQPGLTLLPNVWPGFLMQSEESQNFSIWTGSRWQEVGLQTSLFDPPTPVWQPDMAKAINKNDMLLAFNPRPMTDDWRRWLSYLDKWTVRLVQHPSTKQFYFLDYEDYVKCKDLQKLFDGLGWPCPCV